MGMSESEALDSLERAGLSSSEDSYVYANATESLRKLLTQVERDVIPWRPEPGDKVGGILVDIADSAEGEYGSYIILTIERPDARLVAVHCFHTVLRKDIEKRLQRGTLRMKDEIVIVYLGEASTSGPSGRSAANLYRVGVNRPEARGGTN